MMTSAGVDATAARYQDSMLDTCLFSESMHPHPSHDLYMQACSSTWGPQNLHSIASWPKGFADMPLQDEPPPSQSTQLPDLYIYSAGTK